MSVAGSQISAGSLAQEEEKRKTSADYGDFSCDG